MTGSEEHRSPHGLVVVAAHGGSAATLLAGLLRAPEGAPASLPAGCTGVVAARTTGDGIDAALAAVAALPPGAPAAVVLSGDAPLPPPPRVRAGLRLLDPAVVVLWLPYVPAWRYGPASPATASPAWRTAARAALTALRPAAAPASPPGGHLEPPATGSDVLPFSEGATA
jgi:hypothetical protein